LKKTDYSRPQGKRKRREKEGLGALPKSLQARMHGGTQELNIEERGNTANH